MAVREYTATHLVSDTRDYNDALTKADVVSLASGVAMGVGGGAMEVGGLAGASKQVGQVYLFLALALQCQLPVWHCRVMQASILQ